MKHWREFCAYNYDDLCLMVSTALQVLDYTYKTRYVNASSAEVQMLGSGDKCLIFEISSPVDLKIKIVNVSGDPLTRLFSRIISENILLKSTSIVDLLPVNKDTIPIITNIFQTVFKQSELKPWEFQDLKFQLAIFLRYRVRKKWQEWLV